MVRTKYRSRIYSKVFLALVLVVITFSCGREPVISTEGETLSEASSTRGYSTSSTESIDIFVSPFEGEPLYWLDDYPVTFDELKNFGGRGMPGRDKSHSHGQPTSEPDLLQLTPAFVRYFALVKEATSRRIHKEEWFQQQLRIKELTLLAGFFRNHIKENALLDGDSILDQLPTRWLKMNFRLRVFGSPGEAQEAYQRAQTGVPFNELGKSMTLGARGDDVQYPETGLIFPDSGFFDPVDDAYLFTLKEGDMSRPVITGLGTAIVEVVERHEMDDAEKAAFLAEVRQDLTDRYVRGELDRVKREAEVQIISEHLAASFFQEVEQGLFSDEIVARIGDIHIPYRIFRLLNSIPLKYITTRTKKDQWSRQIEIYVNDFLGNLALGLEAERLDLGDPKELERNLHHFAWQTLFQEVQVRLTNEADVTVNMEEIKAFYKENLENWAVPETATFRYYFTPDLQVIQKLEHRSREGESFDDLATEKLIGGRSTHGGGKTLRIRERTVYRDSTKFPQLEIIWTDLSEGSVHSLEGPMGYYFIQVTEKTPARTRGLEEVRPQIRAEIDGKRRKTATEKVITGLTSKVQFRYGDEKERVREPDGMPDKGFPETG